MAVEPKTIENFLDAMNIIATHRATESQIGDKTILCTITDDSKAQKESRYTVTDGSTRFDVFDNLNEAGKKKYKVKDQVYVTIPQNDYNKQKLIQGPYMADSDLLPVTYVSPLDSFVDMATLTKNESDVSGSLRSNGEELEVLLWSMNCKDSTYSDLQKNNVYDTIGLQASFKCLLDDFNMRSGSYGLRMDLAIRLTPTSDRTVRKSIYLDSSEFFGNPYAFTLFSPQAQTYDISSLGIVDGIAISLYQRDDFTYFNGKDVVRIDPKSVEDNIFVTDIYIALGSEISKVTDNTVKLYTDDELTYSYNTPSDTNNSKTLGILWYNKTEENQYVGFSDGRVDVDKDGNIIHYDELEYLEIANAEERLLNQKSNNVPSDENGLTVAANWQDANDILTKFSNFLKSDLSNHLTQFEKRVNGVMVNETTDMATYFRGDNGKAKKITDIYNSIVEWHATLKEYFPKALKAAAAIEKHQKEHTVPETKVEITSENIYSEQKLKNVFEDIKNILGISFNTDGEVTGWIFEDLKDAIKYTYPSFQSGYDVWSNKLKQDAKDLKAMFEKLDKNLNGLEARATSTTETSGNGFQYNFGTTIIDYEAKDLSNYDNRYCIYWYRYDSKEIDEDGIMGNGWVRIKPGTKVQASELESNDNINYVMKENLGLPSKYNLVEQVNKFEKKPEQDEGLLQVYLNPNRKKEKFKVAVFYNHEMFESNVLEFENADDVLDLSYINVSDEIEIRNKQNSYDSYQTMYAASNKLSNTAEALVQRQVTVHYRGLMGDDELLSGAQVFWYIPRNATMLSVDVNKLTDENGLNFTTDYYRTAKVKKVCSSYEGPSTKYDEVNDYNVGHELTAVYDKVDGYYSLRSTNAKGINGEWIQEDNLEIIDDKEIYRDGFACFYKTIGFDEIPLTETDENGEEVEVKDEDGNTVLKKSVKAEDQIFQYQIKEDYVSTALNNTIFCVVKYGNNEYSFETAKTFLFGQQGTTGTNYTISITPAGSQTAVKPGDPLELLVKAFDFNNVEMDINTGEIDVSKPSSEPYICNPQFNWLGDFTSFTASSTTNSGTVINDFTVGYQNDNNPTHYGILNFNVDLYNSSHGGVIQLTNYYPVPSSNDKDNYYIEGPTNIVYDSSGTNPSYYKNPYKIFDGSNGNELDACTWSVKYFLPDGKYFTIETGEKDENGNTPRTAGGTASGEEVNFYAPYVPILNPDNTITASQIYISDETQGQDGLPFYPVVTCTRGGVDIWHQPLVIYQNRYPNSMINNWDGNFKIDEEHGTILSQMVGAGIKNGDNTFSGILMGNVGGSTIADNANGLGIYGYHHGAQSLNLSVDGTAFFGKSGRGRIYFDGNSGTISSASYQQNRENMEENAAPSDAGMMIDLDDGFIDMVGTSEFKEEDWDNYQGDKKGHTVYSTGDKDNPGYKEEYGALYKDDGTSSHIRLDVNSPYFQITSQNGNRLLHIGSDDKNFPLFTKGTYDDYVQTIKNFEDEDGGKGKGYYIKSDNYAPTLFSLDDKEPNENGAGMLIDLNSGRIDAYDLKLFSKNLFIDSGAEETFFMLKDNDGCILMRAGDDDLLIKSHSYTKWVDPDDDSEAAKNNQPGIKLAFGTDTAKPYVNIRGKESSIFYVGENSYYIQTDGYSASGKTGAKINLTSGAFNLMGYADSSGDYAGSYVKLSSESPYFRVHLKDTDSDLNLINIGNDSFYMNSPNWSSGSKGMQINMMTPKIEMYKDSTDGIWIDASRSTYPIQIGDAFENTSGNTIRNLRFSWDGGIYGGHHSAKNKKDDYYPWYITPKGVISFNSGEINSCTIDNCTMTRAKISTGTIGGWTIGTNLSGNGSISGGSISGSDISGGTIDGATITGGSINIGNGSFTVGKSGVTIASDFLTFGGNLVYKSNIKYVASAPSAEYIAVRGGSFTLKDSLGGTITDSSGNAVGLKYCYFPQEEDLVLKYTPG